MAAATDAADPASKALSFTHRGTQESLTRAAREQLVIDDPAAHLAGKPFLTPV